MWNRYTSSVIFFCLLWLLLIVDTKADNPRTSARVLAKQTGATQFEEERYGTNIECNDHNHHLKKRASDEDVDYEVYQGVVGRPGIDFPIYPRIPRTSFSCKSFGNGYFADMETDCQVFHICEEGRKISFLCPNGTIFQQSELTCDWWFKVNCLRSSGFYAESSEILNKQRGQRIRPSVPVQGFNILGGGLNIKPRVTNNFVERSRHNTPVPDRERRIDSNEASSLETIDFDDISEEKQSRVGTNKVDRPDGTDKNQHKNNDESQITEESGSLAEAGRNRNHLKSVLPNVTQKKKLNEETTSSKLTYPTSTARNFFYGASTENARLENRGHQRYKDEFKSQSPDLHASITQESREDKAVAPPERVIKKIISLEKKDKSTTSLSRNVQLTTITPTTATPAQTSFGSAELTRFTQFYTPTVPSINKQKSSDGTKSYVNGVGIVTTTENPKWLNTYIPDNDIKSATSDVNNITPRSIVIGMRHYLDDLTNDKLSITGKSRSNQHLSTTRPISTGPTYLPKNKSSSHSDTEASGESFLFAPLPTADDMVSRNLGEMLKTIDIINNKFDQIEYQKSPQSRSGLEIPPSSGPVALVSLAQYFAGESLSGSTNSLYGIGTQKANEYYEYNIPSVSAIKSSSKHSVKVSDGTATLISPQGMVDDKKSDIKSSLLSEKTVNKYSDLFGIKNNEKKNQLNKNSSTIKNNYTSHAYDKVKNFPHISSTDATIRQLAVKPGSRSIAQVFSNALTTYLEDPQIFRQTLESIRPTEPPAISRKANFFTESPVKNGDFTHETAVSYLPTSSTTFVGPTTTESSIAAEINSKFEHSTAYVDISSTTSEILDFVTNNNSQDHQEPKNNDNKLYLPSSSSDDSDEILEEEQSFSFVTPHSQSHSNTNQLKLTTTEKPWKVSEKKFFDPLTINDGLMKTTKSTTASPITYISIVTTKQPHRGQSKKNRPIFKSIPSVSQRLQIQRSYVPQVSDEIIVAPRERSSGDTWQDIFTRYHLPVDTLPSNNGLQRIANKLFGGLNETEALHLKNVMQQAEHNRQVLSLLLLLIQTCDDQNGRALERSRTHLLNALIHMDSKIQNESKQNHFKNEETISPTTAKAPVTAYRRTENYGTSTTTMSTYSTSTEETPSSTMATSLEETTKFEIRVEDPEENSTRSSSNSSSMAITSDQRALELLKSLYSLASKFTSRR